MFSLFADRAGIELFEKIIALVVHEDEGGEILDGDFPDGFHAELREGDDFLGLDVVLGKQCGGAAGGAEIEAAVFVAGIRDCLRAVAFSPCALSSFLKVDASGRAASRVLK